MVNTKTPQQIKDEVEKKIMKDIHNSGVLSVDGHNEETLDYSELDIKEWLSEAIDLILTEYDKSIKEMIEELPEYLLMSEKGEYGISKKELLSKIGDVQQSKEKREDDL